MPKSLPLVRKTKLGRNIGCLKENVRMGGRGEPVAISYAQITKRQYFNAI